MENPLSAALWDYFLSFHILSHTAQGEMSPLWTTTACLLNPNSSQMLKDVPNSLQVQVL